MRGYALAGALASLTLAAPVGCATGSGAQQQRRPSEDILYDAMVEEAKSRGWSIDTASPKYRIVTTEYEALSERLRVRRVMKIVVLPRGGALRVSVAYERDVSRGELEEWREIEEGPVREGAAKEELELARAIERRFHSMR